MLRRADAVGLRADRSCNPKGPRTDVLINYKTMSSADFVDPAHRLCELYRKIDHVDQRFRQTRLANVSIDGP